MSLGFDSRPIRRVLPLLITALALVALVAPSAHATYPGANGKIAFGIGNQLRTINPDGSNDTALTGTSCGYDTSSWSPDGTKIAFRACGDIHVANADGSGDTQVTHMGGLASFPSWSPDGTRIVFGHTFIGSTGQEDVNNIYVINADGTGLTQLTTDGHSAAPDWSPTGTKIAFSDGGIYTMNPDGSAKTRLTDGFGSSWSPDGQQLAIANYSGPTGPDNIYKINADGTALTQLTTNTQEHAFAPAWSPDGTKIVYEQFVNRSPTLAVMNADGSGQTPLSSRSPAVAPAWQPIPGPQRSQYKNAAQFCKAERDFLGDAAFAEGTATARTPTGSASAVSRASRGRVPLVVPSLCSRKFMAVVPCVVPQAGQPSIIWLYQASEGWQSGRMRRS